MSNQSRTTAKQLSISHPEKRWHTRFVVLHCLKFFSSLPITPVSPHHLFISLVGLQEMLHWFTKEKHYSIEDLVESAIKLSVSDVLDTDKATLIPGEVVEANLADLKWYKYLV